MIPVFDVESSGTHSQTARQTYLRRRFEGEDAPLIREPAAPPPSPAGSDSTASSSQRQAPAKRILPDLSAVNWTDCINRTCGGGLQVLKSAIVSPFIGIADVVPEMLEGMAAGAVARKIHLDTLDEHSPLNGIMASSTLSTHFTPAHSLGLSIERLDTVSALAAGMMLFAGRPFVAATFKTFWTLLGIEGRAALGVQSFQSAEDGIRAAVGDDAFGKLKDVQRSGWSRLLAEIDARRKLIDQNLLDSLHEIDELPEPHATAEEPTGLPSAEPSRSKAAKYQRAFAKWLTTNPEVELATQAAATYVIKDYRYHPRLSTVFCRTKNIPSVQSARTAASNRSASLHPETEPASNIASLPHSPAVHVLDRATRRRTFHEFTDAELVSYGLMRQIDGSIERKLRKAGISRDHYSAALGQTLVKQETNVKDTVSTLVNTLDPTWRRATFRNVGEVTTDVLRRKFRLVTAEPETVPQYSFIGSQTGVRRSAPTPIEADVVTPSN